MGVVRGLPTSSTGCTLATEQQCRVVCAAVTTVAAVGTYLEEMTAQAAPPLHICQEKPVSTSWHAHTNKSLCIACTRTAVATPDE